MFMGISLESEDTPEVILVSLNLWGHLRDALEPLGDWGTSEGLRKNS